MEWTLALLFVISILLLFISLGSTRRNAKKEQNEIDMIHMALMKEINDMQGAIRNIELDLEVIAKEAGVQLSDDEKLLMREILDLYKRKYSIESIAEKKQVSVSKIEQLLTPHLTSKDERRKAANEN
ncbi:hypothetical protein JK635_00400 [Neobacillus sp. YIM B02564]|jgi:hypothetical protein|uniref:DUF2802 domain-containing protein n=1 Tax=Neobacillus paridis TaxID=2803862 RepID=A0ABS1TI47_9BACI|nr:hypothetical protein [Neobacillus paridis]MBL4950704.1 hypothetical protein [Neobacillus paridis]